MLAEEPFENCPEFLKPRLRLYLSADIIGSTAQKQSRLGALAKPGTSSEGSWFTTIQGFYFEAQQSVRSSWEAAKSGQFSNEYFGESPSLWKTVGDEVLFTKLITDHRQVAVTIQCWIKALNDIRTFLAREGGGRLGVKSTAWLAGFPFRNKEVVLNGDTFSQTEPIEDYYAENGRILNNFYSGKPEGINIDYIGPSIDTGFRLTGLASARKLIVSLEIAYILAITSQIKDGPISPIELRYEGEIPLKGVMGGNGYPVFWIDLSEISSSAALADKLTSSRACDRDTITKYCDAFFHEKRDFIFPPFIHSASESILKTRPPWYDDHHANLVKNFVILPPEISEAEVSAADSNPESISRPEFQAKYDAFLQTLDLLKELSSSVRKPPNPLE